MLQAEGRKRWRVYAPPSGHALPRTSSPDIHPESPMLGTPLLDTVLQPGDLLYLPRGAIHQAEALPESHSLHLTVSANQRRTWLDLLSAVSQARAAFLLSAVSRARAALLLCVVTHSQHVTVSANQRRTWLDVLSAVAQARTALVLCF